MYLAEYYELSKKCFKSRAHETDALMLEVLSTSCANYAYVLAFQDGRNYGFFQL